MALKTPALEREFIEGPAPEYVVNHTTYESAPGGNLRGFVWKLVHGKYELQYTFFVTAVELVQMGRQAIEVGSDAFNMTQWSEFKTEH